jgi:hypothetical protein
MAQFLRPASDVSDGAWVPSAGADLFATIDESSASDADYDYTESASPFTVGLSSGTDPASSANHTVRYRAAGNGALNLVVTLLQTATPIATWTETAASASFTDYSHTLSSGEADAITDYSALRLKFEAVAAAGDVELDTDADGVIDFSGDTTIATNITVGAGNNRALFGFPTWQGAATVTSGSSSVDGAFALVTGSGATVAGGGGGNMNAAWYILLAPTVGAHVVTFTLSAGADDKSLGLVSYRNVNQTTPYGTPVTKTDLDTSPNSHVITGSAVGDRVLSGATEATDNTATFAPDSGTQLQEIGDTNFWPHLTSIVDKAGEASSTTIVYTTDTNAGVLSGFAVKKA